MVIWKGWFETVPYKATLNHPIFQPFVQEFSEHGLQITVCESPELERSGEGGETVLQKGFFRESVSTLPP